MTERENILAILRYQPYERMPVVSFGYWPETLRKWAEEGHISAGEAEGYARCGDNSEADFAIMRRLGFDFNWNACVGGNVGLLPPFPETVLEQREDGGKVLRNAEGLLVLVKPGIVSIPSEIGTTLTDRRVWEQEYLPRLQWTEQRVDLAALKALPDPDGRRYPRALHTGSLIGFMRNLLGVEALSYLYADDEPLFAEIVDTLAGLCYRVTERALQAGAKFDYAHFWEDICFNKGPLVSPSVFRRYIGPHYKRITELLLDHGIDIVSVDCDGCIDALLPIWLENGVNTMFPIEVGTPGGSIGPFRSAYGKKVRGVGGMNKTVFARDYAAIDREIERLRPLIALGGYIPCPDHRIAPDAKFENVQYYCERLASLSL